MSKSKLYELSIDNGDGSPITNFRIAYSIEDLIQDILPIRLSHVRDTINVWELNDDLERTTEKFIHVFNPAIVDFENGNLELPQMPSPMDIMGGMPGGFILPNIVPGPGGCICGQCGLDDTDQLELVFEEF